MFTDEDPAAAFRPPGAGPLFHLPVRTPAALAALLRGDLAGAVTPVAYDPPPPGSGGRPRWLFLAADVVANCDTAGPPAG